MNHDVSIYQRGLTYLLATYLALLSAWCLAHSGMGGGTSPLLVIGGHAGLALLPPLPARELPTPADPPLEFYSSVASIRTAAGENSADVVLIFTHPLNYQMEQPEGGGVALLLYPLDRASLQTALSSLEGTGFSATVETVSRFGCRLVLRHSANLEPHLERASDGRGTSVTVRFEAPDGESAAARGPGGRVRERARRTVAPGLELLRMDWFAASGSHADLHVLEVDLAHGGLHLAMAVGEPVLHKRTKLSTMAHRAGALAALNASFFGLEHGEPLGLLIDRGTVISAPVYSRTSFGVYQHQRVLFGNPDFSGRFNTPGGNLPVRGLNEHRNDGSITVYTPEFGQHTRTKTPGVEVAVSGGRVVGIGSQDLVIPDGGIVVALHGGVCAALSNLTIGDEVTYEYGVTPPWSLCDLAVGGGPRLVKDGKPLINSREERFDVRFTHERAPRSAVGVTRDGKLILAALDGRHPPRNCGATLAEMARVMLELNCVQAMNLDGGGSTAMVVEDQIINTPSDGREREVSTGILVLAGNAVKAAAAEPEN
jgi:hypothetical protein